MTQQVLNKLAAREAVRVDTSKPTFQAKLGRFPATLEVMQFLGFSSAIDNPLVQTCTPTESDRLRISRAQAIIQAAFQQATPNASESAYAEFLASQEGAARVARGWDPIVYEPREVRVGGSTVEEPRASSGRLNALASRFGNSARAMDEDSYSASDTALIMSVLGGRLNQEQSLITSEGRFLTKAEAEQLEQAKAKVYDSTIFRIEFADQHRVQLTFPPSAPFETVFDALDKILNPNVVARDYCLRIGPKLLTRTRGIVDLTKSSSQWPPERVARSPYLSFTDARLVPAVHARIQWLDQDMETPSSHTEVKRDVDGLSASTCLRPEVFARRVPYQEVSVPKPLGSSDNTSSVQASAGTQTAAAPREAARSTTELSDADLDRLTEQMLSGNRGRVGGTSGTKPGNKVPAWFAKK